MDVVALASESADLHNQEHDGQSDRDTVDLAAGGSPALLGVSTLLGWLTTPELLLPERMALSYAPTVLLLIIRVLSELLADRLQVAGPPVVVGYLLHAVVLLVAVALNPFVCIYAFFGYLDADRFLGSRLAPAAVVLTGLTCAFGQAGGLPGVSATPSLFVALALVNVTLAMMMMRIAVGRERGGRGSGAGCRRPRPGPRGEPRTPGPAAGAGA